MENDTVYQSLSHTSAEASHTFRLASAPSKNGYTFAGWTDGSARYLDQYTTAPGTHTLYAAWTAIPYTVTYMDGLVAIGQETYSAEKAPSLLPWSKPGYQFLGWAFNGQILSVFPSGMTGDITLTAQWKAIDYTVTFNTAGGTPLLPMTYTVESSLVLPTPTREAYMFTGWVTLPEGNSIGIIPVGTCTNLSLMAQWKAVEYTVTFDAGAGSPIPNMTYTVETGLILPTPVRDGYTFAGWVSVTDGRPVTQISRGTRGNTALVAQWKANTYTITYLANGGTPCEPTLYTIESGANLPAPVRPGYQFLGWRDTLGNAVGRVEPGRYGNLVLTAEWVELTAVIRYMAGSNGGKVSVAEETVGQATGAPASAAIPDAGYRFAGWYRDPACTIPVPASWVDAANVIHPQKDGAAARHGDAVYYARFELRLGSLTIPAGGVGKQSLLFTVAGTPTAAELSPVSLTVAIPAGQRSATICDLPVGIYTVTEQDGWSWRYAGMSPVTLLIEPEDQRGAAQTASFIPRLIIDRWLGDIGYRRKEY